MKARKSTVLKLLVGFFTVLALLSCVASVYLWAMARAANFDTSSYAYVERSLMESLVRDQLADVYETYSRGDDPVTVYAETNLIFRITDEAGYTLAQSENAARLSAESFERTFVRYTDTAQEIIQVTEAENRETVHITGDVDRDYPVTDRYSVILGALRLYYDMQHMLLFIAIGCALVWLICQIWLMSAAGYAHGSDEPRRGWLEYIPFDLLLLGVCVLIALHDFIPRLNVWNVGQFLCALALLSVTDAIVLTLLLMTLATRLKTHSFVRTTVIGWAAQLVWKILMWVGRGVRRMIGALKIALTGVPLIWKTALGVLLNACVPLFAAVFFLDTGTAILFCIVWNLMVGGGVLFCATLMRTIQEGGQRLAAGDLTVKIDTQHMFGDFRSFSENLNRLGDGMSAAVEERIKSERLRTELITNVSHDIKTPLTSIVNYVDLMKKENVTDEPLAGYITVLSRQSARLKKLIEDLVEASKAATGNIAVHPEILDVTTLLGQTAGEYDEKLRAAGLDLIVRQPPDCVHILADGRLLWRVFDNLMNNIVKYAMPGTRVYLTLRADNGEAEILFRNIAREEIGVASDELLERFTRGDASRSTEGSGLGLSIANSLTELQGGKLTLTVDGDLFKVMLRFPLGSAPDGEGM